MDSLIVFGAKYLYLAIVIIALAYLVAAPKSRSSQVIVAALIALPLTYIIAKMMSALYFDPRPFVVGNFVPLIPHAPDNGFPSDHTLLSAAIAAVIFAFDRKIGAFFISDSIFGGFGASICRGTSPDGYFGKYDYCCYRDVLRYGLSFTKRMEVYASPAPQFL